MGDFAKSVSSVGTVDVFRAYGTRIFCDSVPPAEAGGYRNVAASAAQEGCAFGALLPCTVITQTRSSKEGPKRPPSMFIRKHAVDFILNSSAGAILKDYLDILNIIGESCAYL